MIGFKKPWASELLYPSGPYAGQPTKVAPAGDLLQPNTKAPAQNFNSILNDLGGRLQSLVVSLAVGNWEVPKTTIVLPGPVNATLTSACWNPTLQRWAGYFVNTLVIYPATTHDGGRTWTTLGSGGINVSAGALASSSYLNVDFFVYQNGGVTSIVGLTFNGAQTTAAQAFLNTLRAATMFTIPGFGVVLVGSEQAGSTVTGHIAAGTTPGVLWTDDSTSLPAIWQSDTANHVEQYLNANDGTFQAAGNNYLVGMCGVATTDHSRILRFASIGGGITDITPAFLTGKVLSGLCYSDVDALWGITCWDGGGGFYLYTSPDLTTWTLVHNFGTFGGSTGGGGVQAIGGVWCVQLTEVFASAAGGSENNRIMMSSDVGALGASAAWTTASYDLIDEGTGGEYPGPFLISNGIQLLAYNNGAHAFSKQVGFTAQGEL